MKQVFQSLSTGEISLIEKPVPSPKKGHVLIKSSLSLLSSGTERSLIDFGKSNIIQKALKQPDKVKQVIDKTRTDGLISTFNSVQTKLDEPLPLGYCNVGTIIELGEGVKKLKIGQRVVSNGFHAEFVSVPENLCAVLSEDVKDSEAVFTVLGSIGLQGIRLLNPTFGETILVSGLGIIGILSAQILKANGCRVIAIDPDKEKCKIAQDLGVECLDLQENSDPEKWCKSFTKNIGVDGVLITASTKSSDPIDLAAKVSRIRGRIVLVGVTGLEIRRDLFYKKELTFQVSCSYGPGRYDPNYEELGNDYPIGFVRWTQQRNFEAIINSFSSGMLKTESLISTYFELNEVKKAYEYLLNKHSSLGIILKYPKNPKNKSKSIIFHENYDLKNTYENELGISFIGAGNYAQKVLIPCFSKADANLNIISSQNGTGPVYIGKKLGFQKATTSQDEVFNDKNTNSIVIATRHDSHAKYVLKGLKNGKNVFVEKPLCIKMRELDDIYKFLNDKNSKISPLLMVGFNRRFSPLIGHLNNYLKNIKDPKVYIYTCNAGYIEENHWTQNLETGGGRLIGEACHFLDLIRFLDRSSIEKISITNMEEGKNCPDTFTIQILFSSGSIATIHYLSNGSKNFPKERLEVFVGQKIFSLDNFRILKAYGVRGFKTKRSFSQDKGQLNCVKTFLSAIKNGGPPPIPYNELFEIHKLLLETS